MWRDIEFSMIKTDLLLLFIIKTVISWKLISFTGNWPFVNENAISTNRKWKSRLNRRERELNFRW